MSFLVFLIFLAKEPLKTKKTKKFEKPRKFSYPSVGLLPYYYVSVCVSASCTSYFITWHHPDLAGHEQYPVGLDGL